MTAKFFVAFLIVAVLAPIVPAQSGRKLMTREEAERRWGPAQDDPNTSAPASQTPVPNAPAQSAPAQTPVFVDLSGFQNSAFAEKLVIRMVEAGLFGDCRPVADRAFAERIMTIQPNVSGVPVQQNFGFRGQNTRSVAWRVYVTITIRDKQGRITGKGLSDPEVFGFQTGQQQSRVLFGGQQSVSFSVQTEGPNIADLEKYGVKLPRGRNFYGQEILYASLRMIPEAALDKNFIDGQ
jgi:hypothetical protein